MGFVADGIESCVNAVCPDTSAGAYPVKSDKIATRCALIGLSLTTKFLMFTDDLTLVKRI